VQGETWDRTRVERWQEQCGAPVAALTASTLQQVENGIDHMGNWLGHAEAAGALNRKFAKMEATAPPKRLSAIFEVQRSPFWSAGKGTLINRVLQCGGFNNAAAQAGLSGYAAFGLESLFAHPPDVYIAPGAAGRAQLLRQLAATPLGNLPCIRAGNVITMNGDWLSRPGPRLLLGIEELRRQGKKILTTITK
jgi:ABC-type Fe3+-hydroxamate transport system substrate-binding protein